MGNKSNAAGIVLQLRVIQWGKLQVTHFRFFHYFAPLGEAHHRDLSHNAPRESVTRILAGYNGQPGREPDTVHWAHADVCTEQRPLHHRATASTGIARATSREPAPSAARSDRW